MTVNECITVFKDANFLHIYFLFRYIPVAILFLISPVKVIDTATVSATRAPTNNEQVRAHALSNFIFL